MDPVTDLTKAPKKVLSFATQNILAFALLAALLLVVFVAYDSRNPRKLHEKVGKLPGVGNWAVNRAA